MDNFQAINETVPFWDVVQKYLGDIKRGFIRCPAHDEKTPSCKVYAHKIHCFGCGYTADAIRIAADALNIKPLEAAKILNADYHIGLDLDKPDKRKVSELLKAKGQKQRDKVIKLDGLKKQYNAVCDRLIANPHADIWDEAQYNADMTYAEYLGEEISEVERD